MKRFLDVLTDLIPILSLVIVLACAVAVVVAWGQS